jgi:non-ribosomal peptide synthetase component E (peptide arylation enzyme)
MMNIRELLEKRAEKYADKISLYFKDERIGYQDFNQTVNRIKNGLKEGWGYQRG